MGDAFSSLVGLAIDLTFSAILALLVMFSMSHPQFPELTITILAFGLWFRYFTHYSIMLKERNNARNNSSSDTFDPV